MRASQQPRLSGGIFSQDAEKVRQPVLLFWSVWSVRSGECSRSRNTSKCAGARLSMAWSGVRDRTFILHDKRPGCLNNALQDARCQRDRTLVSMKWDANSLQVTPSTLSILSSIAIRPLSIGVPFPYITVLVFMYSRMLKKSTSGVLASLRGSTY